MKLLLTSNGLSNDSIAVAFQELLGKEPKDSKIAFIPTAANAERSNKSWLIDDLYNIKKRGYYVDVIELTALTPQQIKEAVEGSDAIFVGGGNTFYLSYWLQKSGLFGSLPKLLETKVYAGISAGSMIASQSLALSSQAMKHEEAFKDEEYDLVGPTGQSSGKTLKFVDFIFRPHFNSRYFSTTNVDELKKKAHVLNKRVYALDDDSALKVIDGKLEVVTEGEWVCVEPQRKQDR